MNKTGKHVHEQFKNITMQTTLFLYFRKK